MIRQLLIEIGIFLIPFAVYALVVIASRRRVFDRASWPFSLVGKLVVGALLLVILSLVLLANFSGGPAGSIYTPAHMENGKLVPGTIK